MTGTRPVIWLWFVLLVTFVAALGGLPFGDNMAVISAAIYFSLCTFGFA